MNGFDESFARQEFSRVEKVSYEGRTRSNEMFEKARNYDYDLETSVELLLSHENHLDAIVTENPDKYKSSPFLRHLPIWSVQKLSDVYQLEKNYEINEIPDENPNGQMKLFPHQCKSNLSEYRIRNTHTVTLRVFNHLKKAGVKGLEKRELASKIKCSMETIKSIVWDLEHFGMIDCSGDYILAKKNLLDTGKNDIILHLNNRLREHVIVREIYKHLECEMRLNEHGLREIISNIYKTKILKPKTLSDYASRLTSWLIFVKLLEKKKYHGFVIPKNINYPIQEFCIEPEIVQLEISLTI